MADYEVKDLEYWDERIQEKAKEFGLSWHDQEFKLCDHYEMLGAMAYSGMPSHYPHWSYGKAYEKTKTLYDHGVSGLPYEMVINSKPALAYLMKDNTLALQILTMAHVYAHHDFFKNNFTFQDTHPEYTLASFKVRADRVRSYIGDPSVGLEKVEKTLDAAHALSLQCRRNAAIRKLSREEQEERALDDARPPADPFRRIHKRQEYIEPRIEKNPLEPEEDLLLFIRDYNPHLEEWQKDLLTIAHEQAQYFIPQIETKIMNEGWASYWHREILNALNLPQGLYLEFLARHHGVVAPIPRGLNPYHLGLRVWDKICFEYGGEPRTEADRDFLERMRAEDDYEEPADRGSFKTPHEKLFAVRAVDRDTSFLRRFLSYPLMRDMDLFQHEKRGDDVVVTRISDREHWREVKEMLIKNIGMGAVPVIKITDADYGHARKLFLAHDHEGRDLQLEYAEKTLRYLHELWGHEVVLRTIVNGKSVLLEYAATGFSTKTEK